MRINPLRERWACGEAASCLWIDIGWPMSVGYAAKLMIKAAGDVLGQVFPGRTSS